MRTIATGMGILLLAGCGVALGDDCGETAPRQATLDAAGATRVEIVAGAGSLDVHAGDAGRLVARGTACASGRELLDRVELVAERRGSTLRVETVFPERLRGTARLDLEVAVPPDLPVSVRDGSGSARIAGVAALTVDDGSGELVVADVRGDVRIEDGSGSLDVSAVGGDLRIEDGSGEIDVRDVDGTVRLRDGSGSLTVRRVGGDVVVEDDGSGGIDVLGVGGSVTVEDDGSGGIRVRDVRGDFTLGSDGGGDVDVDVDGRVRLPSG